MPAYYNEIDPYAAQWLRNLVNAEHIAPGVVDERSIVDVRPDDLRGYEQCHFFAGIGGWSYALRLAGWQDHQAVWTGSCPCQPLSVAGQRKGHADERHLWPAFFSLIAECSPSIVFGEQVASKDGREWLAGVRADLEAIGYACGAADLCAAGVGSPQKRQRLFWMADANGGNASTERLQRSWEYRQQQKNDKIGRRMVNAASNGWGEGRSRNAVWIGRDFAVAGTSLASSNPWQNAEWIECSDGKFRRLQPGISLLAHGISARISKLRGFGGSIVPQLAAEFIKASFG